jgi:hypothetical protein
MFTKRETTVCPGEEKEKNVLMAAFFFVSYDYCLITRYAAPLIKIYGVLFHYNQNQYCFSGNGMELNLVGCLPNMSFIRYIY